MTSTAAKSFKPDIDIRWNHYVRTHSYYSGVDLPTFTNHVDSELVRELWTTPLSKAMLP
jgi:hypothetical protein